MFCRNPCSEARRAAHWIQSPPMSITGTADSGTKTSGPPMKAVSARKRIRKGRSTKVSSVPELKKSRSASNSLRLLTSAPVDSGFLSKRILNTLSTSLLEITTSALRPATSTKYPRRLRSRKSQK